MRPRDPRGGKTSPKPLCEIDRRAWSRAAALFIFARTTMKFESLKIEAPQWGDNKGKLVAEICIKGDKSRTTMVLPDEVGEKILRLAKEAIIDGVEKAANDFIFEITTAIPETLRIG